MLLLLQLTEATFKNCPPFIECITKNDEATIDDAEELGLVMLIYNSLEYSSNYSETTESLWFCSKDEATNFNADFANTNNFKYFLYKLNYWKVLKLMEVMKFQKIEQLLCH